MTRLELMKYNQKRYADLQGKLDSMTGIERAVAEHITLAWIKGVKWMGGISDSRYEKASNKVEAMGYDYMDIEAEFDRQVEEACELCRVYDELEKLGI